MQDRKFRIGIVGFPYAGNGGTKAILPEIADWMVDTVIEAKSDPRIECVLSENFADTPITMNRNRAVQWAKDNGVDFLLMIDSDNIPDLYVGKEPGAKPFFETAFNFFFDNYDKGGVVIGSPYCGPLPDPVNGGMSLVYVFKWANNGHLESGVDMRLEAFGREEAEVLTGIQPVAALPTGVIGYDIRVFDLISHPYFDYEWKDDLPPCKSCGQSLPGPRAEKCSTEDVVNTRNLSLNGHLKLGRDVVYCAWDCWSGHAKPTIIGKPRSIKADAVSRTLRVACRNHLGTEDRLTRVTRGNLPAPTNEFVPQPES